MPDPTTPEGWGNDLHTTIDLLVDQEFEDHDAILSRDFYRFALIMKTDLSTMTDPQIADWIRRYTGEERPKDEMMI